MDAPWRVRIRDGDDVLGTGILVRGGRVLTCAHVISPEVSASPPHTTTIVDLIGLRDCPCAEATIVADCWCPPDEHTRRDELGDVALLELAGDDWTRLPAAPLRRMSVRQTPSGRGLPHRRRRVRACGYPDGAEMSGVWAQADLAGAGPGEERIQLDSVSTRNPVTSGFSGAGVIDEKTQAVIGMVVSQLTDRGVSWMLPIETILGYLPCIKDCVEGKPAVDRELSDSPGSRIDVDLARQIVSWLRGRRRIMLIITGESMSSRSAALRRVIRFADRESRPSTRDRSIAEAEEGTVPPVGSVDLALDVSGKTVDEVSRRIAERLGIPVDEFSGVSANLRFQIPLLTLVVDGVDDAAQPTALLNDLLMPLNEQGVRLLLGFHRESSSALSYACSRWPHQDKPDGHPDIIRLRLDELGPQIADVADREDALRCQREEVAASVAGIRELPTRGWRLRLRLSALRRAVKAGEWTLLRSELDDFESVVERVRQELEGFQRALHQLMDQLSELAGRLKACRAKAADYGLAEDVELDALYRQAHEALPPRPCDPVVAEQLVDAYQEGVRRRCDGMRR